MVRKFETLEEINAIPGYLPSISRGEHEFAAPLGYYRFKKKIHCALRSCNQPHNHGYVVRTVAGAVVAIGNICGSEIFGDIFTNATIAIDKEIARQLLMQSLDDKLRSLPHIRLRAEALLNGPRGARWLERAEQSLRAHCSSRVLTVLYGRVESRDGVIEDVRERTKHDPPPRRGDNPNYISERVGVLRGLRCLASPSPRSLIETNIVAPLPSFMTATAGSMIDNKPYQKRFSEWHRNLEIYFKTAEAMLQDANQFYETSNLRLLAHLARHPGERTTLSRLRWNEPAGVVELAPLANAS
jgi:hypothetical protein